MKRNYVGLSNTLHDSALAIVDAQGAVRYAEATERHLQNKRSINCVPDFFAHSAKTIEKYCDAESELVVAQSWSERAAGLMEQGLKEIRDDERRLVELFGEFPDFMRGHISSREFLYSSQTNVLNQTGNTLKYELNQRDDVPYLRTLERRMYDHHLTHAAVSCYSSPFDEAAVAVMDALGEGSSTCCYTYRDGRIGEIKDVPNASSGSLGFFYTFVCATCGFGHLTGEEWKVMGLAAYGNPREDLYNLFRPLLEVDGLTVRFAPDAALVGPFKKIHDIRRKSHESPFVAADIARAGQRVFSEVYFELLNNLARLGISRNLVVGGGCALNSSANGRILRETPFEKVHIFSAPGDDGNALGAAWLAYYEDHPEARERRDPSLQSPYLGSEMSADTLGKMRSFGPARQSRPDTAEVCRRTAAALADGKLVGWVQGRAEYGPRALGNRSILADARDPGMKDKINSRVKFRESYRPFAPSILHEHGPEYMVDYQESPYMERTLRFRDEVVSLVPAVVHEDGTGRLQTVKKEWNEKYHLLIEEFYRLTGVPLILNTSFNVMGKPIIHTVEDALSVFYTSGLDLLVIGDVMIEK
jgi:carbamoyltransferase